MKRDESWLQQLLDDTWDNHFSDVAQDNIVRVRYGRRAKTRLGSISVDRSEPDVSVIRLNGLFRDPIIPQFVIEATLVHELIHYSHGFNSPHQQRFRHPHAGGVMRAEYAERGLEQLYVKQKRWLKQNWAQVVAANFNKRAQSRNVVKKSTKVPHPFWIIGQ